MANTVLVLPTPWSSQRGRELRVLEDDAAEALRGFDSPLLGAICPVGTDAIFNRFQIPRLIQEWEHAIVTTNDPTIRANLEDVLGFVKDHTSGLDVDVYVLLLAD